MELPHAHDERVVAPRHYLIGVDEAGRGPLAGPVVAAAACLRPGVVVPPRAQRQRDVQWRLIRDSKTLTPAQRQRARAVVATYFHTATGLCDRATIDRMNIQRAALLAMKKAVQALLRRLGGEAGVQIIVDGPLTIAGLSLPQEARRGADATVLSVAAASIVAKGMRDDLMVAADAAYPQYGFAQHKGYGTAAHLAALRRYGPTPLHRRSFAPVRRVVREIRAYGGVV